MKKILIIQIRQLGDVLLSTPLAETIKNNLKDSEVHFLTSKNAQDILTLNPYIDKIHIIENGIFKELSTIKQLRKENFDIIIDVQRTGRSKRVTLLSGAKQKIGFLKNKDDFYYNNLVKKAPTNYILLDRLQLLKPLTIKIDTIYYPKIFFDNSHIIEVTKLLDQLNLEKFFLISPTARRKRKMYPPDKMSKLIDLLQNKLNLPAIISYGPDEFEIAQEYVENCQIKPILLPKPLPIKVFAAFLNKVSFFIGNNSFASHIALSQNIKSAIFTGVETKWFDKNLKYFLQLSEKINCNTCEYSSNCDKDKSNNYLKCFEELDPNKLAEKICEFVK